MIESKHLPPTTTEQENITKAGQRKVNLIWEYTQAIIAIYVVIVSVSAAAYLAVFHPTANIPTFLAVAFGMIVGFYFSRTNHVATGGVGPKEIQEYIGR